MSRLPGEIKLDDQTFIICAALCGQSSEHHAGQFVSGNWVCSETCRKELAHKLSTNDLIDSGGLGDCP